MLFNYKINKAGFAVNFINLLFFNMLYYYLLMKTMRITCYLLFELAWQSA